jgi:hypothetical protein
MNGYQRGRNKKHIYPSTPPILPACASIPATNDFPICHGSAAPCIKPYHLIAWFDVDEKGNAALISFNPSKDGGYNKRLTEVLRSLRFRPGVHADGTPMRDTVDVHFIF